MATIEELESLRWDLRRDCVDIIMAGAGGHIGGDMSVIDALMTLYANHLNISPETVDDPNRDRFVLSKGHAMEPTTRYSATRAIWTSTTSRPVSPSSAAPTSATPTTSSRASR